MLTNALYFVCNKQKSACSCRHYVSSSAFSKSQVSYIRADHKVFFSFFSEFIHFVFHVNSPFAFYYHSDNDIYFIVTFKNYSIQNSAPTHGRDSKHTSAVLIYSHKIVADISSFLFIVLSRNKDFLTFPLFIFPVRKHTL